MVSNAISSVQNERLSLIRDSINGEKGKGLSCRFLANQRYVACYTTTARTRTGKGPVLSVFSEPEICSMLHDNGTDTNRERACPVGFSEPEICMHCDNGTDTNRERAVLSVFSEPETCSIYTTTARTRTGKACPVGFEPEM
ncbi:hypothetical protein J6590_091010 [Homalodisca vitripennis]|nr:hypothetical protein J6590_091010 [Homalodisca vitripennis]